MLPWAFATAARHTQVHGTHRGGDLNPISSGLDRNGTLVGPVLRAPRPDRPNEQDVGEPSEAVPRTPSSERGVDSQAEPQALGVPHRSVSRAPAGRCGGAASGSRLMRTGRPPRDRPDRELTDLLSKRSWSAMALTLVAAGGTLAACGSTSDDSSASELASPDATTATEPAGAAHEGTVGGHAFVLTWSSGEDEWCLLLEMDGDVPGDLPPPFDGADPTDVEAVLDAGMGPACTSNPLDPSDSGWDPAFVPEVRQVGSDSVVYGRVASRFDRVELAVRGELVSAAAVDDSGLFVLSGAAQGAELSFVATRSGHSVRCDLSTDVAVPDRLTGCR